MNRSRPTRPLSVSANGSYAAVALLLPLELRGLLDDPLPLDLDLPLLVVSEG
jgi:hypothetical protein